MDIKSKKYKRPLKKSILVGCAVFCVIAFFATGSLGAVIYYTAMMSEYESYMSDILKYVSAKTDGDDIQECIESGESSENFLILQDLMNEIKESFDIEYIYIVKPLNTDETDNMMNVMAGVTQYEAEYEAETLAELGQLTGNSYSSEVAALYLEAMELEEGEISFFRNNTDYGYDYTGIMPVKNSEGESVAVLAVDISIDDIISMLRQYMILIIVGVVILIAIFLNLIYRWLARKVIQPISKIQAAAEEFVEESRTQSDPALLQYKDPEINSGDEIQSLSSSLVSLAGDLKSYMNNLIAETKENERIGTELALASKIQADMLPCIFPAFPDRTEFDIYATMEPAKEVGGDFYDFFMVDERHLAVVMADVSGKGVPAALFMVIGKTLIKDHTRHDTSLGDVFSEVNNMLCESNSEGLFITAFEGVLDITSGEFRYVNAGHEPPYIYRSGKGYERYKVASGFVLAGMNDMRYKEGVINLGAGDRIFLYTDGVSEAENTAHELYGADRIKAVLDRTTDATLPQMLSEIRRDIDAFSGGAEQFDDITMLCLEYRNHLGEAEMDNIESAALTVAAKAENKQLIEDFISERLEKADCPMDLNMKFAVVIDEIFSNIVYYAYEGGSGDVTVSLDIGADFVKLTFMDEGVPFDPLSQTEPDVTKGADEREIGGLGIFMVKKLMDNVAYEYRNGKNIFMAKKSY